MKNVISGFYRALNHPQGMTRSIIMEFFPLFGHLGTLCLATRQKIFLTRKMVLTQNKNLKKMFLPEINCFKKKFDPENKYLAQIIFLSQNNSPVATQCAQGWKKLFSVCGLGLNGCNI